MSLADRLGQRRTMPVAGAPVGMPDQQQLPPEPAHAAQPNQGAAAPAVGPTRTASFGDRLRGGRGSGSEVLTEVRKRIHRALVDSLGPKLYEDAGSDVELAQ